MDTIWLLTQTHTKDPVYLRYSQSDDTERIVGPFAYSTSEAAHRGAEERFNNSTGIISVDTPFFVQALFNGFPPSQTDVLVLDDAFFPLSPGGAEWVDRALGHPQWSPLFDEDGGSGLTWLDRVLFQVGTRIGLDLPAMRAIGDMATTEDDLADEVEQAKQMVQENVKVAIIPELDPKTASGPFVPVETTFWLHTKGLEKLGIPELEIRGVPAWWVTAAGAELNAWAAYSTQHPMQEGQTLQGGGPVPVLIRVERSSDPYWAGQDCFRLVLEQVVFQNPTQPHTLH